MCAEKAGTKGLVAPKARCRWPMQKGPVVENFIALRTPAGWGWTCWVGPDTDDVSQVHGNGDILTPGMTG